MAKQIQDGSKWKMYKQVWDRVSNNIFEELPDAPKL